MMAKQNLNFDPYKQALSKLDQARAALQGSSPSFSLRNFENENIRVNDEIMLMVEVQWHTFTCGI